MWRRYKDDGDDRARERLVLAYSPLVKYVAGRMSSGLPAHVEDSDLISYGLLGLISAIERFEPEREIKFETFAITRIKGSIIDELRSLDWVPRSVRTKAREIEKANAKLTEAQKKVANAGSRANLDVKGRIDTAIQQRTMVTQQLDQLPTVKDDQWESTTKSVDKRLEELESLVDNALEKTNKL